MTYLYHLRQTVSGPLPGGERWSTGLSYDFAQTDFTDDVLLRSFNTECAAVWTTWMQDTDVRLGTGVGLTEVETRLVGPDGKTVYLAQDGVDVGAGSVSISMPNQIATVCSLLTRTPGARGRGRMYWPTLAAQVGTNGRMPNSMVAAMATAAKDLLDGLNQVGEDIYDPQVVRACVASGVGTGRNSRVLSVRIGDVLDDQRRRRDALPEAYQSRLLLEIS